MAEREQIAVESLQELKQPRASHARVGSASSLNRRTTDASTIAGNSVAGGMAAPIVLDDVDSRDDSAAESMRVTLAKQREQAVLAQARTEGDKPITLKTMTCVVCMDTPTDLTAGACGHVFCHTCLMDALIAGENRSRASYEPRKSQCPVCRKHLNRAKTSDVIPMLLMKSSRRSKGKSGEGHARSKTVEADLE